MCVYIETDSPLAESLLLLLRRILHIARRMVCVSVCWAHWWAVQKWLNRSRFCLEEAHAGLTNHVVDKAYIGATYIAGGAVAPALC